MPNWLLAHWRRVVMQITLGLVLLAMVALAQLVSYEKRQALRVELDRPQAFGHLRACLPHKWTLMTAAAGSVGRMEAGGDLVYVEEFSSHSAMGRRVTIARQRCGGLVSPVEHLLKSKWLAGISSERELLENLRLREAFHVENVEVAGWPGKMITQTLLVSTPRGQVTRHERVACAMLPGNQSLVIKLQTSGADDPADDVLMRQLTDPQNIAIEGVSQPKEADAALEMPEGVSLTVPRRYYLLPADDPNRVSRTLQSDASSDGWTQIELIPCIFFADDAEDALATLLLARDRDWKLGPIKSIGPRMWQADTAEPGMFPSRAYLLADGEGQALLAVFHGGSNDNAADFQYAWQAIASTVRFTHKRDLAAMLRNGANRAASLAETGLQQHLDRYGQDRWSRWDQNENVDKALWLEMKWTGLSDNPGAAWEGDRRTALRDPYAEGAEVKQNWSGTGDFKRYAASASESAGVRRVQPQMLIEYGRVRTRVPAPRVGGNASPLPAQYVPGGWLPLLLGKMYDDLKDRPTIFRAESFLDYDGLPLPGWLLVSVWYDEKSPPKPESGSLMPCLTVMVNGTGKLSRWYFTNESMPKYIDFADGLRAQRDGDPQLRPGQR